MNAHKRVLEMNTLAAGGNPLAAAAGEGAGRQCILCRGWARRAKPERGLAGGGAWAAPGLLASKPVATRLKHRPLVLPRRQEPDLGDLAPPTTP